MYQEHGTAYVVCTVEQCDLRNPLPMPDPGDGPRIDSISHGKRPRASLNSRSMTVVYYKMYNKKIKFFLLYTFQYTIYYSLNNNNDNNK
jgi:hypothetical protein